MLEEGLTQSDYAANSCFFVLEDEAHAKNDEGRGVSPYFSSFPFPSPLGIVFCSLY